MAAKKPAGKSRTKAGKKAEQEPEIIGPEKVEAENSGSAESVPPFIDMSPKPTGRGILPSVLLVLAACVLSVGLTSVLLYGTGFLDPQNPAKVSDLENRMQNTAREMSSQIRALESEVEQLKARNEAALALFGEFDERLAALADAGAENENVKRRLAELDALIAALQQRGEENRSLLMRDAQKVEKLARTLDALRQRETFMLPAPGARRPADRLIEALAAGAPFETELQAVEAEGGLEASFDWIRPHARTGIVPLPQLTEAFQERIPGMLALYKSGTGESLVDRWAAGLGRWISIRRTEFPDKGGAATDPERLMAQIENALIETRAEAALGMSRQLPPEIKTELQDWIDDLQAYVESRRLIALLSRHQNPDGQNPNEDRGNQEK